MRHLFRPCFLPLLGAVPTCLDGEVVMQGRLHKIREGFFPLGSHRFAAAVNRGVIPTSWNQLSYVCVAFGLRLHHTVGFGLMNIASVSGHTYPEQVSHQECPQAVRFHDFRCTSKHLALYSIAIAGSLSMFLHMPA